MSSSNKELNEQMGLKIRQIRKLKGISQDDLAAGINLTRTSLVNIEKGRQGLSAITIHNICQYLNINPADIFPDSANSINLLVLSEIAKLKDERDDWKNKYTNLKSLLSKITDHLNPQP